MNPADPLVTVLMSVHNNERFVRAAIESILTQTYNTFEFIIINDASTDRSREIIGSFTDARIKIIDNSENLGLTRSLNIGLDRAQGTYIARMDADDISLPERLGVQVRYMEAHPEISVCGSWVRFIDEHNTLQAPWCQAIFPDKVKVGFLFGNPLAHPSVIIRKKILDEHHRRYDPAFRHSQDYALWISLIPVAQFANIPHILLHYRSHPGQIHFTHGALQLQNTDALYREQLRTLGIEPTEAELLVHNAVSDRAYTPTLSFFADACMWLSKLQQANDTRAHYPVIAFRRELQERWRSMALYLLDRKIIRIFPDIIDSPFTSVPFILTCLYKKCYEQGSTLKKALLKRK